MAMTVNRGGNDGVIDDGNVMRSPSPTGPLHRAFRKDVFRPRGTAKPFFKYRFPGAGGRLPKARRGRVYCAIHHHHHFKNRFPATSGIGRSVRFGNNAEDVLNAAKPAA